MGIPIGWNVKREEAKERDVLRADVTGQRSPIRRRVRPNRSHSTLDTDFLISASSSAPHIEWTTRPSRTRLAPPPVPEVSRTNYPSNESLRQPPTLQREESSLRRSRNRLDGYMRAYETRAALDNDRPPPAFTPGFAPAAASRVEADALLSRIRESTPYRSDASASLRRLARSRSPRADRPGTSGEHADAPEEGHASSDNNAVAFPPLRRMGRRTIADGPLPSSSLRESWSPAATTVDGLGDRNRSVSPLDDQLQWDSFLTTVVDDPVAPTAGSSFVSAAASASFSNSHPSSRAGSSSSAASSQTHVTVPSRRASPPQNEQFMRACDTSDDSASDTEEEEMDVRGSIRRRNQAEAIQNRDRERYLETTTAPRRRMRPSYFSNEPPARDTERYSPRVVAQSRDASAYVRSFYTPTTWRDDALEDSERREREAALQFSTMAREAARRLRQRNQQAAEETSSEEEIPALMSIDSSTPDSLDRELRDARALLERLSRREDISDDFWASVGLTRSFADPVERFQERERL